MSVITKSGDDGKSRWNGRIVDKDSELLEAIGTIDELMAIMGIISHEVEGSEKITDAINKQLYLISGYLAGYGTETGVKESVKMLENDIERMEKELMPVHEFLKAGGQLNIWWNWGRTVARRAERAVVRLSRKTDVDKDILIFLNRLSDYLFILGRALK